jgi:hypothetical protein
VSASQPNARRTRRTHLDVSEARHDQVFQQLAADAAGADYEHFGRLYLLIQIRSLQE